MMRLAVLPSCKSILPAARVGVCLIQPHSLLGMRGGSVLPHQLGLLRTPTLLCRQASSAATGAPYTNSITFAPNSASKLNEYTVAVRMPDAAFEVNVFGRDTLEQLKSELEKQFAQTAGSAASPARVSLLVNGRRLDALELAERRISGLFGCALDVEVNGVRWNVNEGFRLSEVGRVAKRSLIRGYIFLAVGGALLFIAALETWRYVVPKEKQRIY